MSRYGVLGIQDICAFPEGAKQYSPLIPGSLSLEEAEPESLAGFTVLAPPGTIERRYQLALALRALAPGATLVALAPKQKGGSRLADDLRQLGCEVSDEPKSHHRICTTIRPEKIQNLEDTIALGAPRFSEVLGLHTQPGVFSWDRIDPASKMLAENLPALSGRGADLGCGLGFLSLAALRSPRVEKMVLFDIDRRAIEATKKNVDRHRCSIQWANLREYEIRETGLDFVVMNPPFHENGIENRELGLRFLQQAAYVLKPKGSAWLVANRHLPYEAEMHTLFSHVRLVVEENGFKIFEAIR